jgi:hypothetical protein
MAYKKPDINIYNDVIGHTIYDVLTKDLSDEEKEALNKTVKEFAKFLENDIFIPALESVEETRTAVSKKMLQDAAAEVDHEISFTEITPEDK